MAVDGLQRATIGPLRNCVKEDVRISEKVKLFHKKRWGGRDEASLEAQLEVGCIWFLGPVNLINFLDRYFLQPVSVMRSLQHSMKRTYAMRFGPYKVFFFECGLVNGFIVTQNASEISSCAQLPRWTCLRNDFRLENIPIEHDLLEQASRSDW